MRASGRVTLEDKRWRIEVVSVGTSVPAVFTQLDAGAEEAQGEWRSGKRVAVSCVALGLYRYRGGECVLATRHSKGRSRSGEGRRRRLNGAGS